MSTATKRKRPRANRISPADGNLITALHHLQDAITALTRPQPHPPGWVPSRYHQLLESINFTGNREGTGASSNTIPLWIDPFMLADRIQTRTHRITGQRAPLPAAWQHHLKRGWRPQDTEQLEAITTEIQAWCKAIDDLFAPKPVYLPDPCPHCGQTHTHRRADDGQTIRTPALAVTVGHGATCQACHDTWPPEQLPFLARRLGYRPPQGITA